MFLVKNKTVCLFLIILSSLLVSTAIFAVDKRDFHPTEKANFQPKSISWQMEDQDNAPTVENMLRAKKAGDFEKAARIQAILNEEAKKVWRCPGGDGIIVESPYPITPQRENAFYKPYLWGNDVTIATGPVFGGLSTDYDESGNLYAVRCTTYMDSSDACIRVYKSTDDGASWDYLTGFFAVNGSFKFSYPVVLTGSIGNKLYIFFLQSTQNGDIGMACCTQSGGPEGFYAVKADADTITYYSVCTNFGGGSVLMVAYQKETATTPKLYTIISMDYGETWGDQAYITDDGAHPDIAYGRLGYVYLVWEKTSGGDYEIVFGKSALYCTPGSWQDFEYLTDDLFDDTYPKIAALHTEPEDTACVWVAYNHDYENTGNIDLRYAYSTNSGKTWSKNHDLAASTSYDEMASDLKVYRSPVLIIVDLCYLKHAIIRKSTPDVCYTWAYSTSPDEFHTPHKKINDHWPYFSPDGREVCQLTFSVPSGGFPGIVYAGVPLLKGGGWNPSDGAWDIYFDYYNWTDVEEDIAAEELPAQFSLSANYPNPFNPVTRIQYTVCSRQTPEKAVGGSQFTVHGPIPTTLKIYNILGQVVRTLVNEPKEAGTYEVIWDGGDENGDEVASGVYFYKLEAENFSQTKKMVLIR